MSSKWRFGLLIMGVMSTWSLVACAQEPTNETVQEDAHLKYLVGRQQQFTLTLPDATENAGELRTTPLFRWKNPVSGADGGVFLWTHQGRPVVLAKTHLNDKRRHYVESMTPMTSQRFEMLQGKFIYWAPASSDAQRHTFTNIEPPSDVKGLRLTQMRGIARKFRMTSLWGEPTRTEWELRLLTTPLHRYESPAAKVLDGAIFGYAQGTNPEAVLIVEAISTENGPIWEACPARLTGYEVKAWLDDKLVLNVPYQQKTPNNGPYFHHHEVLSPYPFPVEAGK